MDPRTPTWPNSPTPTQNCSRLQQLAKEVDQYSTFKRGQQLTIDALKAPGVYDTETPYVKELLNSLYELLDLHPRAPDVKKLHTIAEELILPAAIEIVETMFGDNFAKELQSIPLSNDTVSRRIDDIAWLKM
ncbi:hypothetical protein TNCV_4314131 [Trichonephila clavipes]|nr:hypothetical protein TNCV_4314131 [Trichonephila clavipes]